MSVASHDVDRVTKTLTGRMQHLVHARLSTLAADGFDLHDVEANADHFVDAMLKALPAPSSVAAEISGPVWTTEQVRVALGPPMKPISRQAVDDRVRRGTLLALRVRERGERAYPLWQFTEQPGGAWVVSQGLIDVLQAVPERVLDRWTLASWLQRPHPGLDDEHPLEALAHDRDAVLAAARSLADRWSR